VLVLFGVAAAFRAAFLPHMTESSVTSKLAEANHPVAVPPQWLPVILSANTPVATTNGRRLSNHNVFATKADLKTAVGEYNTDKIAAEGKYGQIETWDVSGITDMSWLFYELGNIDEDISNWDTSGVTDMSYMFRNADTFNQPLSFDTSRVTSMTGMFQSAVVFNQPLSFDTSRVTSMAAMFQSAVAFNKPLSFDTSRVTSMDWMFKARALDPNLQPRPPPSRLPATPHPASHDLPCDSAGREEVQPDAELRHLRRHEHAQHVFGACPRPDLQPSPSLHAACTTRPAPRPPPSRLPARTPSHFVITSLRLGRARRPSTRS